MFFNKPKSDNEPAKKSSLGIGALFNPQFGQMLKPLGETTSMFVKMLALVFAMNGLFPKNHPALLDIPGAKLTLAEIINTAWRDLTFTREGAPKVILFFAVVGTLALSALVVATVLILMFMGQAHAATSIPGASPSCNSTVFCPPDSTNDIAYNWLKFLFMGTALPSSYDSVGYMAQSSNIQKALVTALGFYSNAILVFAGFILFYHLVSMVVETAHTGVPMGKRANQIWAPIRLVVAVGLLVPVSSGSLNCGQYIAIQMAQWGTGLASQVWKTFVGQFGTMVYVSPPPPDVYSLAEKIVKSEACFLMFETENNAIRSFSSTQFDNESMVGVLLKSWEPGTKGYEIRPKDINMHGKSCGYVTYRPIVMGAGSPAASLATAISSIQETALNNAFSVAQTQLINYFTTTPPSFIGDQFDNDPPDYPKLDIVVAVANSYQRELNQNIAEAMGQLSASSAASSATSTWTSMGWIAAGAYFNDMARAQGDIETAVTSSLPSVTGPNIEVNDPIYPRIGLGLSNFDDWLQEGSVKTTTDNSNYTPPAITGNNSLCNNTGTIGTVIMSTYYILKSTLLAITHGEWHLVDIAARFADSVASRNCVWSAGTPDTSSSSTQAPLALGIQFYSANPFAEMVRLGYGNLNTAYQLLDAAVLIKPLMPMVATATKVAAVGAGALTFITNPFAGAVVAGVGLAGGKVMDSMAAYLPPIFMFLATVFFACGFLLAYFLPLIPFITFLMNALTWLVMVIESVVMMPLVALAHLNPEGDGLPGAHAKNAYFFLFGIFLRPVLMIFGLIAGWLVFMSGTFLMNKLYFISVAGSVSISGGAHIFVSKMVFSILYVALLYIICHKTFLLIGAFPDHAMQWLNAAKTPGEPIGQAQDLGQIVGLVSGYSGQQTFQKISEVQQNFEKRQEAKANENAATAKHEAQIGMLQGIKDKLP